MPWMVESNVPNKTALGICTATGDFNTPYPVIFRHSVSNIIGRCVIIGAGAIVTGAKLADECSVGMGDICEDAIGKGAEPDVMGKEVESDGAPLKMSAIEVGTEAVRKSC